jgi:hypothetical protein
MDTPARILLVAYRTAATQALYNAVRERAKRGACEFHLVVPRPNDADTEEAEITLELALPFLERAARAHIDGSVGSEDPVEAVRALHAQSPFDEVVVSTLPVRLSKWLHRDLPHRIMRELDLPVTVITAPHQRHRDAEHAVHATLPDRL